MKAIISYKGLNLKEYLIKIKIWTILIEKLVKLYIQIYIIKIRQFFDYSLKRFPNISPEELLKETEGRLVTDHFVFQFIDNIILNSVGAKCVRRGGWVKHTECSLGHFR